jgi:hypothetical protein
MKNRRNFCRNLHALAADPPEKSAGGEENFQNSSIFSRRSSPDNGRDAG